MGNDLLEQIITGDERWAHFWTRKKIREHDLEKKEEAQRKFKNKRYARQVTLMAFSDCCDLVYAEFGPHASKEKQNTQRFNTLMHLRNVI